MIRGDFQASAWLDLQRLHQSPCMGAMRQERLTYYEAAEGKRSRSGMAMSLGHQFIVKTWINRMEENLAPVRKWLA